jgi:hypothetical protein
MTDTLDGNFDEGKRTLPASTTMTISPKLRSMPVRNSRHPVKLRAQRRAEELGKSLGQVYAEAEVNRAYLSEIPKTGQWRADKLAAIAKALEWSIDELLHGAALRRRPPRKAKSTENDLLAIAMGLGIRMIRNMRTSDEQPDADSIGQFTRMIYEGLRLHVASGEQLPSQGSLDIWGQLFLRELMALLKLSDKS